jgi:hypothetical protein
MDPDYFGRQLAGESWAKWRAMLLAIAGEPLEPDEARIFTSLTRRQRAPQGRVAAECWLVMGRRSGESVSLAVLTAWLASCFDYRETLAAGEIAQTVVVSQSKDQAGNLFNLIAGVFAASTALCGLVINRTADTLSLQSKVDIVVRPANWRSTRGQTAVAVLCDEIAYWRSDDSAVPDTEVLRALRPSLLTTGGPLLCISTPYAKRGELWRHFSKYFGKDSHILVANAASTEMNPTLSPSLIAQAYEDDPEAAAAEIGAQFRSDIAAFISRDAIESCVSPGVLERAPLSDVRYFAFVDPSGGSADSMTLAVSHCEENVAVLDAVREVRPPFSPESVVAEFAALLKTYRIGSVRGDRYAGEWPREQFRKHGIDYLPSDKNKSEIYGALLPLLNSRRVDLLDDKRLIAQLCGLERRTARGGRDSIDHGPGAHDDLANAVAGALVGCNYRPAEIPIVAPIIIEGLGRHNPFGPVGPNPFAESNAFADQARCDADPRSFGFTIRK